MTNEQKTKTLPEIEKSRIYSPNHIETIKAEYRKTVTPSLQVWNVSSQEKTCLMASLYAGIPTFVTVMYLAIKNNVLECGPILGLLAGAAAGGIARRMTQVAYNLKGDMASQTQLSLEKYAAGFDTYHHHEPKTKDSLVTQLREVWLEESTAFRQKMNDCGKKKKGSVQLQTQAEK
jgi:hypothetical protein